MRVLYVTNNAHLRSTSTLVDVALRRLAPRGLEPVMVFRDPGPWQEDLAARGVPCHFHPLAIPDKTRPLRSLRSVWRLVRLVRRERIDLIHCNEHDHYPLLRHVARWSGRPMATVVHWNVERAFGEWAFRPPYVPDALLFVSRAVLDVSRPALAAIPDDRLKVIMNGLEMDEYLARGGDGAALRAAWGAGPDTVVLGTASAIRPRKTLEDFVRLVRRLLDRGLRVRGVIAGGGRFAEPDYLATLHGLVRELRLQDECLLVGNLDPITPFMKAIDVFVSTSKWETFGLSVCEAMVCGKPAVAYDAGSLAEVIPDPWCVVPHGDLDGLTDRAARLVADPEFRRDLGGRAERFVREHFDAPVLAARQQAIYEEILGRPLAPRATPALCPS